MQFLKLARVSDFTHPQLRSFRVMGGRYIGIGRREDGTFYAMEIACKHQNADLTQGRREGDIATCPRHGWKYNLRTGECVLGGHLAPLRPHTLRIEGDAIYVSLFPEEGGDDGAAPSAEW